MRTTNASLPDPLDSRPLSFPPPRLQVENEKPPNPALIRKKAPPEAWTYSSRDNRRLTLIIALAFSTLFHSLLFFTPDFKRPVAQTVVDEPLVLTLIKLPEIPEDPDDTLSELEDSSDAAEGVDVPRQADIPTSVVLSSMIVQRFDPRTLQPNLNVTGAKLLNIPASIRVGGTGGHGLKEIFNFAELDRQPTALFQPPPTIPASLRQEGTRVELTVELIVDNKGNVVEARVIRSTNEKYNEIAVTGLSKWRFKPGMKKGRYVASRIHQPMVISIQNSDE